MADEKTTTKPVQPSPMDEHLKNAVLNAEDLKTIGVPGANLPTIETWKTELAQVKQTNPKELDPVRVQIAVQRVVISVINPYLKEHPDLNAVDVRRKATSMIRTIAGRIVGS